MPMREEVFGIVVDHQHELVRANVEVMSYRLCHLSLLLADFHDRIQAPISWTDHLKHPLVLRSSFEKCGKIFVWIRVLHGGRVAALTVIDPYHRPARKRSACHWLAWGSSLSKISGAGRRYAAPHRPRRS